MKSVQTMLSLPLCLGLGSSFVAGALEAQDSAQAIRYRTHIMVYNVQTKTTKSIFTADGQWHSPNWTIDGRFIIADMNGDIYRIPVDGDTAGPAELITMSQKMSATNDRALSYDGKLIAMTGIVGSIPTPTGGRSLSAADLRNIAKLFVMNMDGSDAHQVQTGWLHGWTPDGKRLLYVTNRKQDFDIFSGDVNGGGEKQLTTNNAQDDGPESSADGKWIYFCSNRSGKWDAWRMPMDGAGPDDKLAERITFGDTQDWFPHVSNDGKWLYTISYPMDHPDHQFVGAGVKIKLLRLENGIAAKGASLETVSTFFGGQGSGNTTGWAPDSSKFAWTVYEVVPSSAK